MLAGAEQIQIHACFQELENALGVFFRTQSYICTRQLFHGSGGTMTAPTSLSQIDVRDLSQLTGQARKASELMKALSHETRLLIVCLLSEGEKSVSELERALDLPQATVSQQLARLRLDRVVTARRDGRTIFYSIADNGVSAVVCALHDLFCKGDAQA